MWIIWMMIPIAVLLALGFLITFILSAKSGQFDDLDTPPNRILIDETDDVSPNKQSTP